MTAPLILPQLPRIEEQYPDVAERLRRALAPFVPLSADMLPPDALLREFFG
jgi:hypothetical protein